ncbi:MAG: hypothetical protein HYT83_03845 [Candidatus Levybacteria bacterium]|nr:hypothetical protein [Candidatus Levybacteria bacterium]
MVGGSFALREYTLDIGRPMHDLDLFCKAGDYPKTLIIFNKEGYKTSIPDERWLAKIEKGNNFIDLIFSSPNYINPVDDSWLSYAKEATLFGIDTKMIAPEELIWCKAYIQERIHFDGADINHLILRKGDKLDWKRLLMRMENHWDLLLSILINFRFVYPSERGLVPKWLMNELISRLKSQLQNPIPKDKICRGPLLSRTQYEVDTTKNGFKVIS